MNRVPSPPLTAEERELAEQLTRLGPHGGPSSALDQRILAAAHAAVAAQSARPTRHRRRWPIGLGIAASALLAMGLAWQLRPVDAPQTTSEAAMAQRAAETPAAAPPATAFVADEPVADGPVAAVAEPAATDTTETASAARTASASSDTASKPAPNAAAADSVSAVAAAPITSTTPTPAPPAATVIAPAPATSISSASQTTPSPADADAKAARRALKEHATPPPETLQAEIAEPRPTDVYQPPAPPAAPIRSVAPPPAPPAPAPMAAPAYAPAPMIAAEPMREMSKPQGEAMQAAAARADAAAATQSMSSAATAKAESAQQLSSSAHAPIPTIEPAPTTATTKSQVAGASVSDDTRLSVEHWLQQIRLRLKLKDEAGARESLRLFQLAHPRYPLPDDLRDLPDLPVK